MYNKVLQLGNSKLISSLAIITYYNTLVIGYMLLVLGREVVFTSKDNKGQDYLPSSINSLDYYNLLIIT